MRKISENSAESLARVQELAVQVGGYESFAELAALALTKRLLVDQRPLAARRVIRSYLKRHPMTPRIARQLTSLG